MFISKSEMSNLIFDLEETFRLNFALIETYLKDLNYDNKIYDKLNNILKTYKNKKDLIEKKKLIKSNLLINQQVKEEISRRQDEDEDIFMEKKNELNELNEMKSNLIKQSYKKRKDVEIYARREFKDSKNIKNNIKN